MLLLLLYINRDSNESEIMSNITEPTIKYFCSFIQKCIDSNRYVSAESLFSTTILLYTFIPSTTISDHFKWIMNIILNTKISHLPSPLLKSISTFFNILSNKVDTLEYYNKIITKITTANEEVEGLAINYNDLIDNISHFILCCYWNYTFIINLPTIPNDNNENEEVDNSNNNDYKGLITERNFREKFILNILQNIVKTITPLISTPDCLTSYTNLFKILKCIYQCAMKSIQLFCSHSHFVYYYYYYYIE